VTGPRRRCAIALMPRRPVARARAPAPGAGRAAAPPAICPQSAACDPRAPAGQRPMNSSDSATRGLPTGGSGGGGIGGGSGSGTVGCGRPARPVGLTRRAGSGTVGGGTVGGAVGVPTGAAGVRLDALPAALGVLALECVHEFFARVAVDVVRDARAAPPLGRAAAERPQLRGQLTDNVRRRDCGRGAGREPVQCRTGPATAAVNDAAAAAHRSPGGTETQRVRRPGERVDEAAVGRIDSPVRPPRGRRPRPQTAAPAPAVLCFGGSAPACGSATRRPRTAAAAVDAPRRAVRENWAATWTCPAAGGTL
jgi:hypothetical protein